MPSARLPLPIPPRSPDSDNRPRTRRTLIIVCHPRVDSLTRSAAKRVRAGLHRREDEVRVLDLDEIDFDPRLSVEERSRRHLGLHALPELAEHFDALAWADGVVFVYPTWYSAHPARLKGWFDRVMIPELTGLRPGPHLPGRRGGLRHIRRLDIVTSHGSSRLVNHIQVHAGQRMIARTLRLACHPLCRTRRTVIYSLDQKTDAEVSRWLDEVEERFAT